MHVQLRSCACDRGHASQVTSVLMDESSGQLFTGSFDGTVRVWSCTTGEVRGWLAGCGWQGVV